MDAIRKQARTAGLLYLLVMLTAPIGLIVVPNHIIVTGDAAATAQQLRSSGEWLRMGMASELFHQTIEVFLVLVLYGLFKPVNRPLARQMAVLGLLPIPMVFLNVANEAAALTLASGAGGFGALSAPQLDALAMLFIRLHGYGLQVAGLFWGLWLFPFGLLIMRCGFIPKPLGVLVMIAGAGYIIGSTTALIVPQAAAVLSSALLVMQFGELPVIFWLAIWGARQPPAPAAPASLAA
jgi:hypothetical protein